MDRATLRRHRIPLLAAIVVVCAILGALYLVLGDEKEAPPVAVRETSGSPKPWVGASLDKERRFTYFDTAYGKCLKQNGVTKLPPLSEPLVLNTSDPAVAKAAEACRSLRPTRAPAEPG